jgi:hypothetical protein
VTIQVGETTVHADVRAPQTSESPPASPEEAHADTRDANGTAQERPAHDRPQS